MNPSGNTFDDFTAIRGIGLVRDKWLRETFNISTYQELANLSISQVEIRLKKEGKVISRSAIESWIEQARALARRLDISTQVDQRPSTGRLVEKLNSTSQQNGWTPFASFLVYFQRRKTGENGLAYQTLVHYMEKDLGEDWSGIEVKKLSDWMLGQIINQVDLPAEKERRKTGLSAAMKEIKLPSIEIQQLQIFQSVRSGTPDLQVGASQLQNAGKQVSATLERDRSFQIVVDFLLSGENTQLVSTENIQYQARCYSYDIAAKASNLLAETPLLSFERGRLNYTCEMPETSLPEGEYRLFVLISTPQSGYLTPDFLELHSLNVA